MAGLSQPQAVRIGAAGGIVINEREDEKDERVSGDRPENKSIAETMHGGTAENGRQRHRAAWRVQAAQRHHGSNGKAYGKRAGKKNIRNE